MICLKRAKTFLRRLSGGGHQLASYSCLGIPFSSVDASKLENDRYGRAYQGQIQEFLIEGVQTLVQRGLLNFLVANYFSEMTTCFSICGTGNTAL